MEVGNDFGDELGQLGFVGRLVVVAVEVGADLVHVGEGPGGLGEVKDFSFDVGERDVVFLCRSGDGGDEELFGFAGGGEVGHGMIVG